MDIDRHEQEAIPDDGPDLGRFKRLPEFLDLLNSFLGIVPEEASTSNLARRAEAKDRQLLSLENILLEYQEQSYLLDPHLEQIVLPPISVLQEAVKQGRSLAEDDDLNRIARLLYLYTRVRGYKQISQLFPHEVSDLIPTVFALEELRQTQVDSDGEGSQGWELRYTLLLWLSVVCMVPFDLAKFDAQPESATTTDRIIQICQSFLALPGKEREAAAVVLGKLLQRRDVSISHLSTFIIWSQERLSTSAKPSIFLATGILQTFCELLRTSTSDVLLPYLLSVQGILSLGDYGTEDSLTLQSFRRSSLINKYRSKLATRMGLKLLKPCKNGRGVIRRQLAQGPTPQPLPTDEDLIEVPTEIDDHLGQLLNGLQDSDTIVRYSAAKGIARLCERLPATFIDQIVEEVLKLFTINVWYERDTVKPNVSSVSDHTWQGACLALAELARRGLLNKQELGEILTWIQRALLLDIRRGSHSIGSAVRDSACYFVWAIARAYDADTIRPHALSLARNLLAVTLLDREVAIRRAASAAFQESVGRLGLFPHGIDVIGKTDFFSVGLRRKAFLECLPAVAKHAEYRSDLLDHLLAVTIRHWDLAMRTLGSEAVAQVALLDLPQLAPAIVSKLQLSHKDTDHSMVHGTLLTLARMAEECRKGDLVKLQTKILKALDSVNPALLRMSAPLVHEAACRLLVSSTLDLPADRADTLAKWDSMIESAFSIRQDDSLHQAGAAAFAATSRYRDVSPTISSWLGKWPPCKEPQGFVLALGAAQYRDEKLMVNVLNFLLALLEEGTPTFSKVVAVRRNASEALCCIWVRQRHLVSAETRMLGQRIFKAHIDALNDYTMEKGADVGSQIRSRALEGLSQLIRSSRASHEGFPSKELFCSALAGIAKQMAERIDSLRAGAARIFLQLYVDEPDPTMWPGRSTVQGAFFDQKGVTTSLPRLDSLRAPEWLFLRLVLLLRVPAYRLPVLKGLIGTLASRTDLSLRIVGPAILDYVMTAEGSVPKGDQADSEAISLLHDLTTLAEGAFAKSQFITGAFQTINVILEGGVLDIVDVTHTANAERISSVLERLGVLCTRAREQIRYAPRLIVTLKLCVNVFAATCALLVSHEEEDEREQAQPMRRLQNVAAGALKASAWWLGHSTNPTFRTSAAESLLDALSPLGRITETGDEDKLETVKECLSTLLWDEETLPTRDEVRLCGEGEEEKEEEGTDEQEAYTSWKEVSEEILGAAQAALAL